IRMQADEARIMLEEGKLSELGELLESAWQAKRGITSGVSSQEIDDLHDRLMQLGASGAKLLGAGGGGFFLVHGDADLRTKIQNELGGSNRIIPLGVDFEGSTIIHNGGE
ncbi:MAG: hypothetical protein VX717_01850, partial [Candidatus Thermoplasmatota archaeon]|nr:hypothetical protein [Candidatus Thermoplasmatota archaeon]